LATASESGRNAVKVCAREHSPLYPLWEDG
jgi:hypothetical protein